MDKSLITIVMPVYNRADVVSRTLDSIAAQTLRPLSLVVVDNNSTDGSLEVVSRWADTHRSADFQISVVTESKPGAAAARNRGLSEVATPYVMFFDSDDIMLPGHAADVAKTFTEHPEALIVGRDIWFKTLDGKTRRLLFGTDFYTHIFHGGLSTQRFAASTELCLNCGGWNEKLSGWDDLDFGLRLLINADGAIRRIPGEPGVIAMQTEESLTGLAYSPRQGEWERSLDCLSANLNGNKLLTRYVELRRVVLAAHYRREGNQQASEALMADVLQREKHCVRRAFYRFAYAYTSRGGRGIAHPAPLILR